MKSHYRGHRIAVWLDLIPQLHRAGGQDVAMRHHHFHEKGERYFSGRSGLVHTEVYTEVYTEVCTPRATQKNQNQDSGATQARNQGKKNIFRAHFATYSKTHFVAS